MVGSGTQKIKMLTVGQQNGTGLAGSKNQRAEKWTGRAE